MQYIVKFWVKFKMNGREFTSTELKECSGYYDGVIEFARGYVPISGDVIAYQIFSSVGSPTKL